jgi:hypothetical protein
MDADFWRRCNLILDAKFPELRECESQNRQRRHGLIGI